jgi:predicted amidophosphoribosyltransferase
LISQYKFAGRVRLAGLFASLLAQALTSFHPGLPVVPVPPRPGRRNTDSVELIARRLETLHGVTVLRLLRRSGGSPQKALDFMARRENLRGRIRPSESTGGLPIPPEAIIIDDVFTTGATADACARALLELGCLAVSVVTLAVD